MKREQLNTPSFIISEKALRHNLEILRGVRERTGCKILLAQKCFSMFYAYPVIAQYLDGVTASGLYEARLGAEEMPGKENHIFSPAYTEDNITQISALCDHVIFNSFSQLEKFAKEVLQEKKSIGIRVNPECSTQSHPIYDPCAPGSRLGILREEFPENLPDYIEGFHFHTLCEQDAKDLAVTLEAFEQKFAPWLSRLKWINFGGGHHITKEGYDIALLEKCMTRIKEAYGVEVYLEPGEAVALNAGELMAEVVDIVHGTAGQTTEAKDGIAILNVSAACHMPDVLEMPYRPPLKGAGEPLKKAYTYTLAGPTCLSGDRIGSYSFDHPLQVGERLHFQDMAIYTMVKTNFFNGMAMPDIVWEDENGACRIIRAFSYGDFKTRLS